MALNIVILKIPTISYVKNTKHFLSQTYQVMEHPSENLYELQCPQGCLSQEVTPCILLVLTKVDLASILSRTPGFPK